MKVSVLFFSVLREVAGADRVEREYPEKGFLLGDLVEEMANEFPGLVAWKGRLLLAVNQEYAEPGLELADGDEVALMPPVQGG
ncbi:MAG: MoaD/ThiS family protein [Verrucomicrobiae bacterium]|nr:MoaD/ThiS family protein [Verrucomicrobiae bacterium]